MFLDVFEKCIGVSDECYYNDYEDLCYYNVVKKEYFKETILSIKEMAEKIQKSKKALEYNDYDTFVELYNGLLEFEDKNLLKELEQETKLIEHYYNLAKESIEKDLCYLYQIDKETMLELEKIKKALIEQENGGDK